MVALIPKVDKRGRDNLGTAWNVPTLSRFGPKELGGKNVNRLAFRINLGALAERSKL